MWVPITRAVGATGLEIFRSPEVWGFSVGCRAGLQQRLGRLEAALADYNSALQLEPRSAPARHARWPTLPLQAPPASAVLASRLQCM